ncbi:MAG: carbohydrate binding domain-containing protein, partial [Caldilineaceae bacterium]|nr:carbohydrate binding domain-containing protein [Caldilineaceae bacterium]
MSITCNATVNNIMLQKNIYFQQHAFTGNNPCQSLQAAAAPATENGATAARQQFIGQAPASNQITYISNAWWTGRAPGMDDDGDLVTDPQLNDANAAVTPGAVAWSSYMPKDTSPVIGGGQGARPLGNGETTPTPTPTPTVVATPQPTPVSCQPAANNLVTNAGFEAGQSPWKFHTNGRGNYHTTPPGFECDRPAQLQIKKQGRNVQLFQKRVKLEANTRYRLSFYAYSNTGNDLKVYLEKNGGNRANYGVKAMRADLTGQWRMFTTEFTASGFNGTAKNARLRFWLAPYDEDGDEYWIDHVVIEPVNNARIAQPAAPEIELVQLVEDPDEAVGGGTISGTILLKGADGTEVPVEEVEVIVADEETEGFDFEAVVETDEAGYYEISGVPAGDHHLTVIPPTGYVGTAVESIHVAGEEGIDRSYTLNQAASVIYLPLVTSE